MCFCCGFEVVFIFEVDVDSFGAKLNSNVELDAVSAEEDVLVRFVGWVVVPLFPVSSSLLVLDFAAFVFALKENAAFDEDARLTLANGLGLVSSS